MSEVTVDASVAIAWLRAETRPDWVDRLVEDARAGKTTLAVPSLFWLEIGNALARDPGLTDDQAMDGLLRFESLGIETVELDRSLRSRALQLARTMGLTTYDASYLALADASEARLATLDRRLEAAAVSLGLGFSDDRRSTAEEPAPYASASDPTSLAAIGAALAGFRKAYRPS